MLNCKDLHKTDQKQISFQKVRKTKFDESHYDVIVVIAVSEPWIVFISFFVGCFHYYCLLFHL